jgi:hypothetical protein
LATRHGDTVFLQQGFGLVFVQIHSNTIQNKWYAHFRPIQSNAPALAAYSMAIAQQAAPAFSHVYNGYFLIKSPLCV